MSVLLTAGEVDHLSEKILSVFPKLESDSRRVAVQLYRLLAKGEPVLREVLSSAAGVSLDRINEILNDWTGVYFDGEKIQGFWGIALQEVSKHLYTSHGRTNYAWCAWDTLFLPEILGRKAEIQSTCPESGEIIHLSITPEGVLNVEPEDAVMSILEPTDDFIEDVVSNFCHFVYFFPSMEVGEKWVIKNPGTRMISIKDAFELGKRRNRGQFKEALQIAMP